MRFVDIRWATKPPGVARFDPHLTVLADFPRPDGGFAGFESVGELLASLADAGDEVEATIGGLDGSASLDVAAEEAARDVVRVDAASRDAARRALQLRRAEDAADMRRIELAVTRVETDATHQEALERLRVREAERERLHEKLLDLDADTTPDVRDDVEIDGDEEPEPGDAGETPTANARDAVSEALARVEQIEMSEPVVPEAGSVELIDRWLDLTTSIAFLSDAEPNGMTIEQATEAVTGTRPKEQRTNVGQIGPDVAEKLLELHRAVDRAEKHAGSSLSGRGARRALAQAREAESEMLASVGFGDYTEYLMSVAFTTEAPTLDQAEAAAAQVAADRVVAGDAVQLADDERWSGLERDLEGLLSDITALFGEEATGDPLEALRNRVVLNPELVATRIELAEALVDAGAEVTDDEHVPDRARAWLDEHATDEKTPERGDERPATSADVDAGDVDTGDVDTADASDEREELERKIAALDTEISVLDDNAAASALPVRELDAELAELDRAPEPVPVDIADMDPADTVAVMREALSPAAGTDAPVVLDGALDDLPAACLPAAFGFLMEHSESHQVVVVASRSVADFAEDWLTARHGDRGSVWRWDDALAEASSDEVAPAGPSPDTVADVEHSRAPDPEEERDDGNEEATNEAMSPDAEIDPFLVEETVVVDDIPDLDPEPLPDLDMWTGRVTGGAVTEVVEPQVEPELVVPVVEPQAEVVVPEPEPEVVVPEAQVEPEPEPEVAVPEAQVEREPDAVEPEARLEPEVAEPEIAAADTGSELPSAPDPGAVATACAHHSHRRASTRCSKCKVPYCDDCLVQIGTGSKPRTLCVECALLTGGVRVSSRRRRRRRR